MEREQEREEFQREIRSLEEQLRRAPQPRAPSHGDVSRPCRPLRAAPSSSRPGHADGGGHCRAGRRVACHLGRPASFPPSEGAVGNLPVPSKIKLILR